MSILDIGTALGVCIILLCLELTKGVGCTLSSDKNVYSLQRLVAKVE